MNRFTEKEFIQNMKAFHQDAPKGPLENECGMMRLMWRKSPDKEEEICYTNHGIFFIPEAYGYEGSLSWMVRQAIQMYEYRKNCRSEKEIAFLFENADITGTEMVEIVKEVGNFRDLSEKELDEILRLSGHNEKMATRFPRFQLLGKKSSSLAFTINTCDPDIEWWLFKAIYIPRDVKGDISDGLSRDIYRELHRYDGLRNLNSVLAIRGYTQSDNTYLQILRRPHGKLIFEDLFTIKDRED